MYNLGGGVSLRGPDSRDVTLFLHDIYYYLRDLWEIFAGTFRKMRFKKNEF